MELNGSPESPKPHISASSDANDANTNRSVPNADETDAKTWFNFGNRAPNNKSGADAELRIHEDSIEYDMKHKRFGKCLIFNHKDFEDGRQPERNGTEVDAQSLYDCFTRVGFDVDRYDDLNCSKIFEIISDVSKEDHTNSDCFVCCILTHGQNENLWGYDGIYALDLILGYFTGDRCKSLAGKPKIFLIQACRGLQLDDGVNLRITTKDVTDSRGSRQVKIPVYSDFLIAYSSFSGFYSFRNVSDGSWFINHFTDVMNRYHTNYDLLSMFTIVNQRIAYQHMSKNENPAFNDKKQVPCVTHTLTRKIFFMPKDTNASRSTYI